MAEEQGTEPMDRLAADPRFQNFAKQADELFNTTLSQEIANSQNFAPNVTEKKASSAETLVPNGVPSNFKTQSYLGGNSLTGPNPGANDPRVSSKDYVNQINDMMSNSKAWETKGAEFAKPYSYNAGVSNVNFDRYYNHPNFQKLGWTPFRDNEMLYNQNSSWWDDFSRMRGQFLGLAGQGFKSMYGWGAGDGEKFDRELADEFTRKMGVMNSTKGGFGGGLINFAGNAAYTVGIMSSFALEELALAGITAASFGTLSEVTVPEMAASAARAGRGLFKGAEMAAKVGESFKTTEQIAKGIDNMEKATDLWKYARGLKEFLPLQQTANYLKDVSKVLKSAEEINFTKLKDFAFIAKGPAALYRDLREINAVMSESRLEGGMVRNDLTQDLVSDYFAKTGLSPSDEEAQKIYAAANEAGTKTTLFNLPAIYLSNKLVFGKMLKGWKPASIALADIGKGIEGTLVTEGGKAQILKGVGKYAKAAYWKQAPSRLIAGTLRYGKANFAEGSQELMQEVISSGAKDYYKKIYSDPNLAGNRQFWASFENGIQDQSNGKGMEVFLSGFFMGSLVQGPQHLIFNTLNEKWTKYNSPEQFQKHKEAREAWENSVVNSYNAVTGKGVVPFFNAIEENMVSQVHLESLMNEAEQKDDRKQGVDVQDESLFTQLTTLLKNGSYDHFIDQLKDMKKLSPEDLGEAFNRNPEGDNLNTSLSERVDSVIGRAEQIRKRYEAMNERFINPFNPSKYSRSTQMNEFMNESLDHHAFEQAKKHAIFADYAFDRATERMSSLLNKVAGSYMPLSKANADDITSIFDPSQFQAKLAGLKKEIEVYGTGISTPEQKALAEKLRVKRDSLKNLGGAISRYMTAAEKVKLEEMSEEDALAAGSEIINNLHAAYSSYVKTLGKEVGETVLDKNITPSFQALIDYIELDHDAKSYAGVINFLHDPDNFRNFNKNIREALATEQAQKDEKLRAGLKEATDRKDKNDLMNALFDEGIWINDYDVEPFKAGDFDKVDFYSIKPLEKIEKTSERYKTVIAPKLLAYATVSGKVPEEGSEEGAAAAIQAEISNVPAQAATEEIPIDDLVEQPEPKAGGQIIYATVGAGKSSLAIAYPDKYVDGDEVLLNHLKTLAEEYNTEGHEVVKVPETAQEAGIAFTEFLKTQTPEDKKTHVAEIQQIFRGIADSGKSVLTASWFARDIADKAYLRKDTNDIMEELRRRGRTNVKTEAQRILDREAAYFANRPFEEIPAGLTMQDLLERGKPSLEEGKRLMIQKIEKLANLDMVDEFENNLMREMRKDEDYLERYGFDGSDINQLLNKRREEIGKTITFASISKGSYLLMSDGTLVQVLTKNKDKTLTVLRQGDTRGSKMTSDELKSAVKIVTKENMKEAPKKTENEIQTANENLKNQKEFLSDPDARKRAGEEAKNKTKDQSDNDLLNSICS